MRTTYKQKNIGLLVMLCFTLFSNLIKAQNMKTLENGLNPNQKSIIYIASLTAKGDLENLKMQLNLGLDNGLTINEIKEILVHTYAYCGFPRSIRGLQTFMEVLKERKAKGIADKEGKQASEIKNDETKYERGKKILEELTKTPQPEALSGYSAFAPAIDTFLKEHLFADIFERDVLTFAQRELVTISVIAAIGDAEPMLKSHLGISLNVGITPNQLQDFVSIIKISSGEKNAKSAQEVLDEVLKSQK